jgi:tetratricopeptide (TPR) repeat protein
MTSNFEHLRETVLDLTKRDQQELAFMLLDNYWEIAHLPDDYELLGWLSLKIGHRTLAIKCAESMLGFASTNKEKYAARINLNKVYYRANFPEKALFYSQLNLDIDPHDFDNVVAYAAALKLNNQREESEKVINELKQCDWITPEQRLQLRITDTHSLLRQGQTAQGIKWFLHSDKDRTTIFDIKGMKQWNGVISPGTVLYVNAGGGVGDEIINIRFFNTLKKLGMTPCLFSLLERPDLAQIFQRHGFDVITNPNEIDIKCPWTYMMSLPIDLNVNENQLWYGPYLAPLNQQKNQLPKTDKFRIGIKCNGNPWFEQDVYRSIPFEEVMQIMPKDAEIYYFDKDDSKVGCINLNLRINTWDDTLDFLSQMDIVISSCTSIIHAVGAMGITGIVCVPILEYYIWTSTHTNESTPWYGSNLKVLKQKKVRSWKEPLERAQEIIQEHMQLKGSQQNAN